jgi:hypothetical protein
MEIKHIQWPHVDLTKFIEAGAFGPEGDPKFLRGSVVKNAAGMATLSPEGNLRLTIDHEDPACHSRVEFTRWPWMDRVPAGTAEVLDFALGFPMGWKNGPEPVSVFQMYCRSANVSVPLVVLELAKEGQIKDAQGRPAKAGQLQVVHKRSDGKYYRALTPFMAQEGTFMPIRMKAVHGQKEGQLSFSVAGQGVYDVVDWMVDPRAVYACACSGEG